MRGISLKSINRARLARSARALGTSLLLGAGFTVNAFAADAAIVESALAPRSVATGATLFTPLPAEQTGVVTENQYADPRMWAEFYQELTFGAIGTGVTVGDYDGDGRPDLFVVSKTERSRLFRNLGDWKFADVTDQAGIGVPSPPGEPTPWTQGATFVDVDNDGRLDLYLCRFNAPNLLFMNRGDGTFREEAAARGLAVVDASGMAAFCDYDRDGWLDVYLQTNMLNATAHPNGQRDHLFRNQGDGTFADVTDRAGIAGETAGHSATWWDYDADGWPDLYVANDFATPDTLYRNQHDGTFVNVINETMPHLPYYAMGADIGDVNNDGRLDLLVADMAPTSHQKDQRGMSGSRALNKENPENAPRAPQYMRNALFVNTGTGRFLEAAILAGVPATDWTWSIRFEDLDNDGRVDLHVTNGMNREYHNADILERIMGAENVGDQRRVMRASPVLAETNLAFRNLGDFQFEPVNTAWGLDQKGVSFGAAFGDFDGDGDLDLVYANYQSGATVLRNDSAQGHRAIVALRGTRSNRFGVGAVVRVQTAAGEQVRELVLARGYLSSSEPIAHFGLGDATRIERLTVSWPGGHTQVFSDLAVDRRFTITEPATPATLAPPAGGGPATGSGPFTDASARLGGAGETVMGAFVEETNPQPLLPRRLAGRGVALAVGDLNGDDRDDLVFGGTRSDAPRVLVGDASGGFSAATNPELALDPTADDGPWLILDADGDGRNDLLRTKGGATLPSGAAGYQPQLFKNLGDGKFALAAGALPALPISVGAAVAADFDRNGRLDLFIGGRAWPGQYPRTPKSALLLNQGGRFEDATDRLAAGLRTVGMVTSALASDVDGDGWSDLVLALEWGGVRYWHNDSGQGFTDRSDAAGFATAGTGWWNSLAIADFNGDARPDYVAGNLGWNTPYRASEAQPALLFRGSFTDSGSPLIVEGYYEDDRLYPRRTRSELGSKIPSILKRFPKNDLYARATLGEILGEDRLAKAQRFAATEFASGVFMSAADGRYRFVALPRIAQIAPITGVVAGDFDGDGHADVYALQNSYTPPPGVGRFDGGLSQLLRGDGRGKFTAVPPAESRLIVSGDAKALVTLDHDGDGRPDFALTRNQGTPRLYRNSQVDSRSAISVVLRGPPGNPTAIGARVTAHFGDGSTVVREVLAGGGYLSQSSATVFFSFAAERPLQTLTVRWPDGASTEHVVKAGEARLTLAMPAP